MFFLTIFISIMPAHDRTSYTVDTKWPIECENKTICVKVWKSCKNIYPSINCCLCE